jgi:GTPase SAR1 family protein
LDKFINQLVDAYLNKGKPIIIKDNNTIKLSNKNDLNDKNNNSGGCCSGGNKKIKQKKYEYILKYQNGCINSVFLGDKGVGKTSIIKRIEGKEVNKDEEHTEQNNKIKIDYNNNQMKLKIIINDVDNDKMKTKEFIDIIKESNIFFLTYDVNNKQTLVNVGFWNEVIKKCKEDNSKENYLLYIIGNKNDISYEGIINKEEENQIISNNENINKKYIDEGRDFSNNNKGIFKIVSALENKGIDNILEQSIDNYLSLK